MAILIFAEENCFLGFLLMCI